MMIHLDTTFSMACFEGELDADGQGAETGPTRLVMFSMQRRVLFDGFLRHQSALPLHRVSGCSPVGAGLLPFVLTHLKMDSRGVLGSMAIGLCSLHAAAFRLAAAGPAPSPWVEPILIPPHSDGSCGVNHSV